MSFATGLKTIVVATGLDGRADGALEYARKLATAYHARMVLAHGAIRWTMPRWPEFLGRF